MKALTTMAKIVWHT